MAAVDGGAPSTAASLSVILPKHLLRGSFEHIDGLGAAPEIGGPLNGTTAAAAGKNEEDPAGNSAATAAAAAVTEGGEAEVEGGSPLRRHKLRYALGASKKILPTYMLAGSLEQLAQLADSDDDANAVATVPLARDDDDDDGDDEENEGARHQARKASPVPEASAPVPLPASTRLAAASPKLSKSSPSLLTPSQPLHSSTPAPEVASASVSTSISASPLSASGALIAPAPALLTAPAGQKKRRPSKGSSVLNMLFHLGGGSTESVLAPPPSMSPIDAPMSTDATAAASTSPFLPNKRFNIGSGFMGMFQPLTRRRSQSSVASASSEAPSGGGLRQSLDPITECDDGPDPMTSDAK